jgi:SulP family sulfate permease
LPSPLGSVALDLPVATIGTQFGGIPSTLPSPGLPDISLAKIQELLPSAISFALLGSIESLLSAVVADGMTGRRHRSNCELVGRARPTSLPPVRRHLRHRHHRPHRDQRPRRRARAGRRHAAFDLPAGFMLLAAPLATFIPLGRAGRRPRCRRLEHGRETRRRHCCYAPPGDAAVLLATFLLTIFRDLTEAIVVGFALGSVLFIHRMSQTTAIETHVPMVPEDKADATNGGRTAYHEAVEQNPDVVVYRISGAFFFGAAAAIGTVLDRIGDTHRLLVIDLSAVPFIDSTAANTIEGLANKAARRGVRVALTGTSTAMRRDLFAQGLKPPLVHYENSVELAVSKSHLEAV